MHRRRRHRSHPASAIHRSARAIRTRLATPQPDPGEALRSLIVSRLSSGPQIDLVLVLDNSGSMDTGTIPAQLKQVATQIVSQFRVAPDAVRVGVVSFNDQANSLHALSSDLTAVNNAINNIPTPNGWTDVGKGLAAASNYISGSPRAGCRSLLAHSLFFLHSVIR